ncbi:putative membrane protein [Sorangium cellulosum So ce56]|uniref:Membrane protein n=1 Tax=Sorangium cellulosum (strain So ce56) TaxID=448385 RepID=A9G415_SORC5|nr:hypothetical protein [Sorangium cellulosum]CAN95820.1 putative membrane protein [Sorangium cellulosum So ce56]
MPIGQTKGSIVPLRRDAAPRVRGVQAATVLAALLGLAAPAAAQAQAAPPKPARGDAARPAAPGTTPAATGAPIAPAPAPVAPAPAPIAPAPAPIAPAPAPIAPAPAPIAPAPAPIAPAPAPVAPAGGALVPIPQGYYLPAPPLPPWANPRTIEYEEGDPIPRGYALRTRADRKLATAGLLTFGIPYALTFTVAGIASFDDDEFDEFGPLLIPFAGPMIAIGTLEAEGAGIFWLTVDAVTQVGGLILYAAGLANEDVYLERQFTVSSRDPGHAASRWPEVSIGGSSASLRWRF